MASDNLNQIGKYVKGTRRDVDFALKRYHGSIPRTERIRDIFDAEIPFEMSFDTKKKGSRVMLNLNFNKPPPQVECDSDCLSAGCQSFNLTAGNHFVTLDNPYNAGSVTVFIDSVPLFPSQFEESSPSAGTVFITSESVNPYTVTVCYTYGDCGTADDEECISGLGPKAYTGLATVFSDRFDRAFVGTRPTGGCGQWGTDSTPNIILAGDGSAQVNETAYMSQYSATSEHWEVLFKFDLTTTNYPLIATISAGGVGVTVLIQLGNSGPTSRILRISATAEHIQIHPNPNIKERYTDLTGSSDKAMTLINGTYYLRFAQYFNGWNARIWSAAEIEPNFWTSSLVALPPEDLSFYTYRDEQWKTPLLGRLSINTPSLRAVTAWADVSQGRWIGGGASPVSTDPIYNWSLSVCTDWPDGLARFGHCGGGERHIDPDLSGNNSEDMPSCLVTMSWPFFFDGPGALASWNQHPVMFRCPERVSSVTIRGEMKATGSNEWDGTNVHYNFYQHNFGDTPPIIGGQVLPGEVVGGASGVIDSINPSWRPFEVTMFPINNMITWSVQLSNIGGYTGLDKPDNGFLFPPTSGIGISFRNYRSFATGMLLCTTHPDCPETEADILARCGPAQDNFTSATIPFACISGNQVENYTSTSGHPVTVTRSTGTEIVLNGEATISYKARGVTGAGSDFLCPRIIDHYANNRSETDTSVIFKMPSAISCSTAAEVYLEMYVPSIVPSSPWVITSGSSVGTTKTPRAFVILGAINDFHGFVELDMAQGTATMSDSAGNSYALPITAGTWYSVKFNFQTGINYKAKFWPAGSTEPGSWQVDQNTSQKFTQFGMSVDYDDFITDNYYLKFRNYSATGTNL